MNRVLQTAGELFVLSCLFGAAVALHGAIWWQDASKSWNGRR